MADTDVAEGDQNEEVPEDDLDDAEKAMLHFGKYYEARRALPWDQWTSREKTVYYMDRAFIGLMVVFLVVVFFDICYKIWYVTNLKKIAEFVTDIVSFLLDWLSTQEKHEELMEL
ncbi:hypothetical protein LDENG_00176020 [Scomber scombrus]|uniref:Uncharacterized protein n=1 Tax=Scomber scombrus TaxID=13677 RepID=A0AAV1P6H7_SCOSC